MWGGEGVLAVAGGAWLAKIAPMGASTVEIVLRYVIGGLGGLLTATVIIFLYNLFRAPYKQRNEARRALEKLSQTPLVVECYSYEYSLAGKDWLNKSQYLWLFNVILTNKSDTQNVSTKAISLVVNYPIADDKVKSYALSLLPDTDSDKYGRPSTAIGKLLAENEYLRPRDSIRGFYQFLDKEEFWKPKLIQTWPTLVVVDSFDAPHRKQFKPSRLASRLKPDKKGSHP